MEITKEQYVEMKKTGNYSIDLFWEFFKLKNTGKEMTQDEFMKNFQLFINWRQGNIPIQKINSHYDEKFKITKLLTKEGILIKEY